MGAKNRKKLPPPSGDESATWLGSYADMMSLLLCFFIIFFSVSKKEDDSSSSIKEEIAQTFSKSPVGVNNEQKPISALQMMVALVDSSQKKAQKESSKSRKDQQDLDSFFQSDMNNPLDLDRLYEKKADQPVLIYQGHLVFLPGSAELRSDFVPTLKKLAKELKKLIGVARIEVAGHTDSSPTSRGSFSSNWALGAARASHVVERLIQMGIPESVLIARSYGPSQPLFRDKDDYGRLIAQAAKKNRRIEFRIRYGEDY